MISQDRLKILESINDAPKPTSYCLRVNQECSEIQDLKFHQRMLEYRISGQRLQLRQLQDMYNAKLDELGVKQYADICMERYKTIRQHYLEIATERNILRADLIAANGAITALKEDAAVYSPYIDII